jgi:diguanylate cyclase (GGDEF)-like protein/PAS domain S-box-containing protein
MDEAFRRFAELCPDAVIVTDRQGVIEDVNPACERLTGYARDELVGRTPALLKSGLHEADFYRRLWTALLAGEEVRAVFCNRRKDGALFYEDKIVRPLQGGFVSFGRDVTARSLEREKLAHAATHDSLTELPNRSLYLDRLGQALRHAARRGEALAIGIMDIDQFRATNNRFGHAAGDAVLQAVAQRTLDCVRQSDTVARIGGDEFALLLGITGEQALAPVLQKIVAANGAPVPFEGRSLPVSVSIGACAYPQCGGSEIQLLKQADALMYQAKHAGGGRYALAV